MGPRYGRIIAVPVESSALRDLDRVGSACGFDVSGFNAFASPGYLPGLLRAWPYRMLAEPAEVLSFDFLTDPLEPGRVSVEFAAERSGRCDGIAFWFELGLDGSGKRVLTNEPANRRGHWEQAFGCLPSPVTVRAGHPVRFTLVHSDDEICFDPA